MANERQGRNVFVSTFQMPDEYERARMEAQRRAALAEMLEAQAYQPLNVNQPAPIAPSQGLAKVLKQYMGAYERRKAREAEEKAKGEELETGSEIMGRLMGVDEVFSRDEQGQLQSIYDTPEQQQAQIEADIARQRSTGQLEEMTPTAQYIRDPLDAVRLASTPAGLAAMRGNPMLAAMLQKSMEEPAAEEFYAPVVGEGGRFVQFGKSGGVRESDVMSREPEAAAVTPTTIIGPTGKPIVVDARTGREIGQAVPAAPRDERTVAIMGPEGPTFVRESEAIGKTPFTAQTLKQEQTEAAAAERDRNTAAQTQITLDDAAALLSHPGREAATGGSSWRANIPGTEARDFRAKLDTLKAQTFLPMVSALRGMGALSDAEGKRLLDAVGALDAEMSEPGFYESLEKVVNDLYTKAEVAGLKVTKPLLPENPYKKKTQPARGTTTPGVSRANELLK
jgi:hypothetical protein